MTSTDDSKQGKQSTSNGKPADCVRDSLSVGEGMSLDKREGGE